LKADTVGMVFEEIEIFFNVQAPSPSASMRAISPNVLKYIELSAGEKAID
jgi:hypothetical protein